MLDEGVESCSDGVHRIYWTRIDLPSVETVSMPKYCNKTGPLFLELN